MEGGSRSCFAPSFNTWKREGKQVVVGGREERKKERCELSSMRNEVARSRLLSAFLKCRRYILGNFKHFSIPSYFRKRKKKIRTNDDSANSHPRNSSKLTFSSLPPNSHLPPPQTLKSSPMVLPHALLQPPIFPLPFLAPFFPPTGPLAWSIRFARLLYTFLFSFPLLFLSSLTTSFFDFSLLPTFPGRDSRTSAFVPFIASLIWCATWGFLDPPSELPHGSDEVGNKAREEGPRLSLWLFGKKGAKVKGVEIQEAEEEWCRGVVKDGFGGKVRRRRVGGSWVWRENDGREIEGDGKAKEGEKVVMYCVGGES